MLQKYGLIFDVDGVIADTEAVNAQASIAMFEELFGIKGVKRRDFEAGLGRGAANYVRAAAEVHGVKLTDEQVESASLKRQENFLKLLDQSPLPAFPGVLELIDSAMNHSSWKLAIATSSTREKSQAVLDSAQIPYKQMVYITGSGTVPQSSRRDKYQTGILRGYRRCSKRDRICKICRMQMCGSYEFSTR